MQAHTEVHTRQNIKIKLYGSGGRRLPTMNVSEPTTTKSYPGKNRENIKIKMNTNKDMKLRKKCVGKDII